MTTSSALLPGTALFDKAKADGTLEKIPPDERLYPYSYFLTGQGRDRARMTLEFLLWHLRYHLSPKNLTDTFRARGVLWRFKLADYLSCIQYAVLLILGKLGLGLRGRAPRPSRPAHRHASPVYEGPSPASGSANKCLAPRRPQTPHPASRPS